MRTLCNLTTINPWHSKAFSLSSLSSRPGPEHDHRPLPLVRRVQRRPAGDRRAAQGARRPAQPAPRRHPGTPRLSHVARDPRQARGLHAHAFRGRGEPDAGVELPRIRRTQTEPRRPDRTGEGPAGQARFRAGHDHLRTPALSQGLAHAPHQRGGQALRRLFPRGGWCQQVVRSRRGRDEEAQVVVEVLGSAARGRA